MEIIDPTLYPDWNEMIASSPEYTFFHSSNWAAVLRDSYRYEPLYFMSRRESKIAALIPIMEIKSPLTGSRGVGIPFTDRCEPIFLNEDSFPSVFDEIVRYGKKAGWKYLELRGGWGMLNGAVPYRSYVRHVLALHGQEQQGLKRLSPATRRNVRKAADSGLRVTISASERDLHEYYRLHCMSRKRHGAPPQPLGFFKAVHSNVISQDKGFTLLATIHGLPISGAVYFHFGKKAIYKFGATDMRYQNLRPANLVMWEAIGWFSENGFDELCFGRTDPADAGLIRFKVGWGAREESLHYYRYDFKKSAFVEGSPDMSSFEKRIFRSTPVPFLRFAGELLYRHMG